jgi:hypothetical protein
VCPSVSVAVAVILWPGGTGASGSKVKTTLPSAVVNAITLGPSSPPKFRDELGVRGGHAAGGPGQPRGLGGPVAQHRRLAAGGGAGAAQHPLHPDATDHGLHGDFSGDGSGVVDHLSEGA